MASRTTYLLLGSLRYPAINSTAFTLSKVNASTIAFPSLPLSAQSFGAMIVSASTLSEACGNIAISWAASLPEIIPL